MGWLRLRGVERFIWMMDRFGPEIEADLRRIYQVDVLDVYRDRLSIRTALNLIDRCPSGASWRAAWLDDDDLVSPDALDQDAEPTVTAEGWTPELERLSFLCDLINQLIAVTVARNSTDGQVAKVKPLPRPTTALDRLREALAEENFQALFDAVQAVLPPDPADESSPTPGA